jgi:hypothetical protein
MDADLTLLNWLIKYIAMPITHTFTGWQPGEVITSRKKMVATSYR